jgi:hypothetical protein
MKTGLHLITVLFLSLLAPSVLNAQLTKIFVASFGNDANDGSRGNPKRNFQAAHDAVAAGGQIVVLDTAGYGQLNITKSVAITVPPGVNGFITVTGLHDGITINAGQSDNVVLRGLIIESSSNDYTGIAANSLGGLTVEDCTVRNFAVGIDFASSSGGNLVARHTEVRDCFAGIWSRNSSPNAAVTAALTDCALDRLSDTAVRVTNISTGGSCLVTVSHCVLSNSNIGIYTEGDGGSQAVLDNSVVHHCAFAFSKSSAAPVVYTRGNNTATFVTNAINNGYMINGLSPF